MLRGFHRQTAGFLLTISLLLAKRIGVRHCIYWAFMKVKKTGKATSDCGKRTVRRARVPSSDTPAARPETDESLEAFFNALDDLVFVFEPGGRILFTNPAAQRQLGYTAAELAGMNAPELHPPELRLEAKKLLAGMGPGKIIVCPIPLQARDGIRILVETKIMPVAWRGQKVLLGISHDVTQRKLAEEAMRESEEKYKALIETTGTGYVILDPEGRVLGANQEYVRLSGHNSLDEIIGKNVIEWTGMHDRERNIAEVRKCLQQGYVRNLELDYVNPSGQVTPVEINATVIKTGQVIHILSLCRNITERKQAEKTLHQERNLFRLVLDNLPSIIFIKDKDGRYVLSNRAHQGVLGVSQEALLGKTGFDFHPPELARQYQEEEKRVMRAGEPLPPKEERALNHGIGGYRWHLTSRLPFKDETGRVTGIVGISHDITERKRAEEVLRESQALYHSFVDQLPAAVFRKDREGRYVMVNPRFCQLKGVEAEEFLGKTPVEVAARQTSKQGTEGQAIKYATMGDEVHEQIMRTGKVVETEEEYTHADGGKQFFQVVRMPVFGPDRTVVGTQGIMFDVTARKRAEEAVRESQALYHSLVEQLTAGVFRKDKEGRYVFVNSWYCRFRGVNAEHFLGKTPQEVEAAELARMGADAGAHPRLGAQGDSYHKLIMQTGQQIVLEEEWPGVDGKKHFLHVVKSPVFDPKGAVVGTQGIMFDITERKKAEQALRQGEVRLEKINRCLLKLGPNFDANINQLTALCGELLGATCALYNRLHGDLLCSIGRWQTPPGFKPEDAPAGHICYDIIRNNRDEAVVITNLSHSPYAGSDPNVRAYGLQTYMGCAVKCEGQAVGSLCVVYNTDYQPTDDDRRILGIIASAIGNEDTRKQAEAELNRLMTAIEQTPESVVITDTEGRILYVNPVFEKVTGYSRAEAIGQNPRLLKSNRQESAFYRELWAKIRAGEVWRGRFVNKKKDGTLYTEDAVIAPVRDEKGTVTNFIAIKRDISHELELEGQYRQTQKIDSIGRLAGGVAHDFNNILAVICGHTDLALAQLSPDAPLRSNLECVQESAERAANLTRQLLAFARRQVIEPRRINLNELIVNLNKMLHRLIGEDVKLVTQTATDLNQVRADPGQIEQVLLNLVVNARDAMPDGGTLTIRTENVTFDADYARRHLVTPGDYVMVSVTDTGVGMTDEVKQHIFEPFFTTKEQGKGTGLGLATCFGIIQQSNGHIWSESQLGKGTEFRFYLPRVEGPEESASAREVPVSLPQGTETILLAEDETSLRQLMARVLRTQGYTVLEAADGHQALTLAQANGQKIQLLITDVIMPGLSGKTLAEWLGQVNPATRVLFISGYINNNAVRDAMSKAGTFFLQKPFNPLDLTKKVREAIETPQTAGL
jgi:two-component system, cell cycle sensor histidine kinase and response regulator CckA